MLSKDLVAASAVPLILSILRQGDNYGYEMVQQVKTLSGGAIAWKEGMVYPVLRRLQEQGYIESHWQVSDSGRKRKYYSITPEGRAALVDKKQEWLDVMATMGQLWNLKLTSYDI